MPGKSSSATQRRPDRRTPGAPRARPAPAGYVATNVELLYATTAHRAQGSTVDACHALITEEMGRENFYVITSRARHGTVLYVATHELASLDEDEHVDAVKFDPDAYAAREILEHVVARETAELSATEQVQALFAEAQSLCSLVPRYDHALDVATDSHYRQVVEKVLPDLAEETIGDPAWHAVLRALRDADTAGWDVPALLSRTARKRELATADSLAQVVSWRLRQIIDAEPAPLPGGSDEIRYRSILAEVARPWHLESIRLLRRRSRPRVYVATIPTRCTSVPSVEPWEPSAPNRPARKTPGRHCCSR